MITEGYVREVIRVIQDERKRSGFHISDRIHLTWNGDAEVVKALDRSSSEIATEVLALSITRDEELSLPHHNGDEEELAFVLTLKKG